MKCAYSVYTIFVWREGPRGRNAPEGIVRPRIWPCYGPTAKQIYPMATVQVPRRVYNGVCHATRERLRRLTYRGKEGTHYSARPWGPQS
jgi:hypothetical protein